MSNQQYTIEFHYFGPSETIRAVIQRANNQKLTEDELVGACDLFNEINGNVVPKLGTEYKIPVLT